MLGTGQRYVCFLVQSKCSPKTGTQTGAQIQDLEFLRSIFYFIYRAHKPEPVLTRLKRIYFNTMFSDEML